MHSRYLEYSLSWTLWCLEQMSWSLVGKQLRLEFSISRIVFWSPWKFEISRFNCTYLIPLRLVEWQILALPIYQVLINNSEKLGATVLDFATSTLTRSPSKKKKHLLDLRLTMYHFLDFIVPYVTSNNL